MVAFTIVNRYNAAAFLGRDRFVRDVPLLFAKPQHANKSIERFAQVGADWKVVEVTVTLSDKEVVL